MTPVEKIAVVSMASKALDDVPMSVLANFNGRLHSYSVEIIDRMGDVFFEIDDAAYRAQLARRAVLSDRRSAA
jgi:hypothetical protein